jgi:uncharacterized membrane protein
MEKFMAANLAKHPIHPMLVGFPIGIWTLSLAGDLIFLYGGNVFWCELAFYAMVGCFIGAVAAAIPGLNDYLNMSASPVKTIATRHLAINLIVVALYGVNLGMRAADFEIAGWPVTLSALAVLLLAVSGWLGGELVYVHGGGVEPAAESFTGVARDERRMA